MNKRQKAVQQHHLNNEAEVIKSLKKTYTEALTQINENIENLMARSDADSASVVYQIEYQKAIKAQISGIVDTMNAKQFTTVSDYLQTCYEDGYIGTFYDLQGQGVPLCIPMNQEQVVQAVQLDSKISGGMYASFGEDAQKLKKNITAEVSRGISTGMSYQQVAQQISMKMMGTKYKPGGAYAHALNIARTEGHRIQCQSGFDALQKAKDKGADVVKQWDSTLDGNTRESHRAVDGEVRELDEKFSNGLMFPGDPSGPAAEVCNCRCALLQRARWALGAGFSKMNNETGELVDFSSIEDYEEFKEKFWEHTEKMADNKSANDWSKTKPRKITKAEKARIIDYAQKNGVNIVDLSKFDGDPDLLIEQIDTISKWKQILPIKSNVTLTPVVMSDDDFGEARNRTIKIHTKALRDRKITNENINNEAGYFASSEFCDIAAHEYGHVFLNEKRINAIEISKEAYYNIYGVKPTYDELIEFYKTNISEYSAAVGKKEFISEVFAKHNSNPNQFTTEIIRMLKGR